MNNMRTIVPMNNITYRVIVVLALQTIGSAIQTCPSHPNCICNRTLSVDILCNFSGQSVRIDVLPGIYVNIKCENVTVFNYNQLPKCINYTGNFKSVSFKNCPLPSTSFKDVLSSIGVSKTMSLIFQNDRNLSHNFHRKHFMGLQDMTKLLLSVNGFTHLPDNMFMDLNNLRWLNIRIKTIVISEELFKPLEKLDTLEINHNHMTNMSTKIFEHLSFLRKFSLWQSNISTFSEDFFEGVETLEELDLSSNGLSELPASIFNPLKNLKKVTLFSNKFSILPQSLFLNNKLLETLIILNNNVKIKELPKLFLGQLPNLKQVYIQRSGIERISYDAFIESPLITNISLAHNEIKKLAESVFNDQINLLELDLSFNNLRNLEDKLFSSLVRLVRLNLRCNSISEISGSTFSPLLSLMYLNMERNNLKIISSNLFENSRQRMTISFAFNELNFENKLLEDNSWTIRRHSPFINTYNLKMLNLSHNKFKIVFNDWWVNGHEKVDLAFNSIDYLWSESESENELLQNFKELIKKPMKEIWIGNNNLNCGCRNFLFLDFIQARFKTKINDIDYKQCSTKLSRLICYKDFYVIIFTVATLLVIIIIITIIYLFNQKNINLFLKRLCLASLKYTLDKNDETEIAVKYSIGDEEFVLQEIVSGLQDCNKFKVLMKPVSNTNCKNSFIKNIRKNDSGKIMTLVIFSPNYLMTTYSHVNIKKIRGEMIKAKKTIYIFVDIGPDNSVYAFLKEQRDQKISILWNDIHFWGKVMDFLTTYSINEEEDRKFKNINNKNNFVREIQKVKCKYTSKMSFMKLSDWPHTDTFETFSHSQV